MDNTALLSGLNEQITNKIGSLFVDPDSKNILEKTPLKVNNSHDEEQLLNRILENYTYNQVHDNLVTVSQNILDIAITLTCAQRGILYLKIDNKFAIITARDVHRHTINERLKNINTTLLTRTLEKSSIIYTLFNVNNTAEQKNVQFFALTLPLIIDNDLVGIIYLDGPATRNERLNYSQRFFKMFSTKVSVILRKVQYYDHSRDRAMHLEGIRSNLAEAENIVEQNKTASKIGHEMNNLLSGLQGNIDVARNLINTNADPMEILQRLQRADELLKSMSRYSDSLLKNTAIKYTFQKSSLNEIIQDYLGTMEPTYSHSGVSIETSFDYTVPEIEIDRGLFKQVIHNFIKNSIEAKSNCRILIKSLYDRHKHVINLIIADDGPGMPKEIGERIFNEKYSGKENGNGYGLLICKEIIEKHHGKIIMNSEPGLGTLFMITIPVINTEISVENSHELQMLYGSWL